MSIIATALKHLIAAGVSGDDLVRAVAELEADLAAMPAPVDRVAEKRRAWDRERKRIEAEAKRSGGIPVDSAESAEIAPLSRPPNEINSNPPTHTPPECVSPRTRKADPFPKPEWANDQHWDDLKSNRKAKRLPNTPTAHAKLLRDIEQWVTDDWPPGRLLEAIAALGWASAQYDPRGNNHGHSRNLSVLPPAGNRGTRPNPLVDILAGIAAEERSERDPQGDLGTWPPVRAIGSS